MTQQPNRPARTWTSKGVVAASSFIAGLLVAGGTPLGADVTPAEQRPTFKSGGLVANQTLLEQLVVLKRLDERIARIEDALLKVVE
jgi:hypothetical protein